MSVLWRRAPGESILFWLLESKFEREKLLTAEKFGKIGFLLVGLVGVGVWGGHPFPTGSVGEAGRAARAAGWEGGRWPRRNWAGRKAAIACGACGTPK